MSTTAPTILKVPRVPKIPTPKAVNTSTPVTLKPFDMTVYRTAVLPNYPRSITDHMIASTPHDGPRFVQGFTRWSNGYKKK
jgi:hypothetical protein